MLKILLGFMFLGLCGGGGYWFALELKKREKFYLSLVDFVAFAKAKISFLQSNLKDLFLSFVGQSEDFKSLLAWRAELVESPSAKRPEKPAFLKDDEFEDVCAFFEKMGKSDVENECAILEEQGQIFREKHRKAEAEKDKKFGAYTKLGFALGCAIFVLIL